MKAGEAPDAGAIAGSGQWHDSPRGVLYLSKHGPGDAPRILEAVKCSYGRDGWGASLIPDYRDCEYRGLSIRPATARSPRPKLSERGDIRTWPVFTVLCSRVQASVVPHY